MNVLVTGSRGFLGHHLILKLYNVKEVSKLFGVCRSNTSYPYKLLGTSEFIHEEFYTDLTKEDSVKFLLECTNPDIIFHLAATSVVKENEESPCKISHSNYLATHHLLAHCKPGTKFVFASTVLVAGNNRSDDHYKNLYSPSSIYGVTKAASELLIQTYQNQGKISASILRLTANVGTGSTHGVLHDFVKKIKSDSPVFDIIGDKPGSTKPYTHVKDTINAFIHFGFRCNKPFNLVNICASDSVSNEKMAEILMKVTGITKPINWLGEKANWKGDNREIIAYNDKARIDGWEPKYKTSEEAIERAIKDIINMESDRNNHYGAGVFDDRKILLVEI